MLTSVLQNTVEDLLAIGVASLAGYISVLGLPQKRAAAKEKLEKVAGNFAKVCQFALETDQLQNPSAVRSVKKASAQKQIWDFAQLSCVLCTELAPDCSQVALAVASQDCLFDWIICRFLQMASSLALLASACLCCPAAVCARLSA